MTKYKMPEVLGGGEVEATEEWGGCAGGRPEYQIGGITVLMPPGMPLEAVKPPLPPEPPDESIVRTDQFFWERCDGGADQAGVGDRWWRNEDQGWEDWAGICEYGTPVRFVPAPEPVELPWTQADGDIVVEPAVGCGCHGEEDGARLIRVAMDTPVHLEPDKARAFALALNTAADQAEATS